MHINSTVGLLRPGGVNLDDGGTYHTSPGQRFLWRSWTKYWEMVGQAARQDQADVYLVLNGDLVDVNGKHQQSQTISLNKSDVIQMAAETLAPALDLASTYFVIRGTAAHVGSSGEMEEILAMDIGAEGPGRGKHSWWELLMDVEGVRFDIRHHGPLGRLQHTRGNLLNRRAVELMLLYAGQGSKIPDVAVQNHNHHFSTSSDEYAVKVFALPAFQLPTEHTKRIGIIELADIGGAMFTCQAGHWTDHVVRFTPKMRRPWRPK